MRVRWRWPPAVSARPGRRRPTRPARPATAWVWPCGPAPSSAASSSCSSTPPFCGAALGRAGARPLVSEAVRGEGAVLVDASGHRIMADVHPMGDLAPRDVVAVAMHRRMCDATQGETTHLYLDATGLGRDVLAQRFPSMLAACRAVGIDPVSEPVPVAPGAHYACGGVTADLFGRTSVAGLFAVGEVAVHGSARRQPARVQLADRGIGRRPAGGRAACRAPTGARRHSGAHTWPRGRSGREPCRDRTCHIPRRRCAPQCRRARETARPSRRCPRRGDRSADAAHRGGHRTAHGLDVGRRHCAGPARKPRLPPS